MAMDLQHATCSLTLEKRISKDLINCLSQNLYMYIKKELICLSCFTREPLHYIANDISVTGLRTRNIVALGYAFSKIILPSRCFFFGIGVFEEYLTVHALIWTLMFFFILSFTFSFYPIFDLFVLTKTAWNTKVWSL